MNEQPILVPDSLRIGKGVAAPLLPETEATIVPETVVPPAPLESEGVMLPLLATEEMAEPAPAPPAPEEGPAPPEARPPRPVRGVPRGSLGVVLLNFTGLSLGYLYLHRWLRVIVYLLFTAGLVITAFLTNAAYLPFLWVLWMAFDGGWLAWRMRRAAPTGAVGRWWLPVVVALLLIVFEIAGLGAYYVLGQQDFAAGVSAHEAADPRSAIQHFRRVTTFYELTFSPNVPEADARIVEDSVLVLADSAWKREAYADAAAGYEAYLGLYPASVLVPFARESAASVYDEWAVALRRSGEVGAAIEKYLIVQGDYPDTPTGQGIAPRVAEAYDEWAAQLRQAGQYAGAIEKYQTILNEYPETPAGAQAVASLVETYGQWADYLRQEGRYSEAIEKYQLVLSQYPDTPTGAQVKTLVAETYSQWAGQLRKDGQYDQAIDKYQTIRREYPGTPIAAQARTAIAEVYDEWAAQLRKAGKYDEAISKYETLLREYAGTPSAARAKEAVAGTHNDWAVQLRKAGRYQEAIWKYQVILTEYPDTSPGAQAKEAIAETYGEWATKLRAAGSYEEAISKYQVILKEYPDTAAAAGVKEATAETYYEWGAALHKSGRYAEAIQKYQVIVSDYPNTKTVGNARAATGRAYNDWGKQLHGQRKYTEAMAKFALAKKATTDTDVVTAADKGYSDALWALSQDTTGEGKQLLTQALSNACAGKPTDSPAIGLAKDDPGKALFGGSGFTLPTELKATKPAHLRYIVCLEKGTTVVERCGPYYPVGPAVPGWIGYVVRQQHWWRVRVRDARTAQIVAEHTFHGSLPRACERRESFPGGAREKYLSGDLPSANQVVDWLRTVIR